ncbi:FAD-dependent monooxygenase [Zoogloea sp.]|uniref:FAD-dependent monooxygenase n=1 Tax=Zoogloea sp. TaxID=49181 RepID=UPI001416A853|nr:MAG: 2-octaprenyl-6-methoxyphenyl hydroxylase [Zoogloea sp.]
MERHDLAIIGAGPVGMTLALALKDAGLDIVLVDARPRGAARQDPRVLALSHGTRLTLERLGIWSRLPATPIETIHVSHQGGLGRALLRADEYGQPALGYVVAAGDLAAALDDALGTAGIPVRDNATVSGLAAGAEDVLISLADGKHLSARLAACAEGAIQGTDDTGLVERDYGQHAVISIATPATAHGQRAWERFTPQGPLAVLPCGSDCAIVHTAAPDDADALMALDDEAYLARLQAHFGTRLRFASVGPRARYPLLLRYRPNPVGQRTVWLGNAAQTLHPVAGQGYNLALRDVWACAQTLLRAGGDPGAADTLAAYARARQLDRQGTIRFTDGLVRLFSTAAAPLKHLRGAGLFALDLLPPARHFVAKRMMFGARAWP